MRSSSGASRAMALGDPSMSLPGIDPRGDRHHQRATGDDASTSPGDGQDEDLGSATCEPPSDDPEIDGLGHGHDLGDIDEDAYDDGDANAPEGELEGDRGALAMERRLRRQIARQVQPEGGPKGGTVEGVLEHIRPNVNDEVALETVLARLETLPRTAALITLLQLLGDLRETHVPKDAIMSIWYKITHPKAAKRVQSAGPVPIIRSRVLESKRKQAECDLQLLQNRIALLQQEESKAWKKIVQTKDRAQEVLEIREANVRRHEAKCSIALEREKQNRTVQRRQHSLKKESIIKKKHAAIQIISKKYQDVEIVKSESKRLKAEKERQQLIEVERAREKRELIRQQEDALKRRKEEDRRQHEQSVALRYMKKVIDEERRIKEQQRLVEEMERQEAELIQRLQGTQLIQREAFVVLEQALLRTEPAHRPAHLPSHVLASSASSPSYLPSPSTPTAVAASILRPPSRGGYGSIR